MMTMTTTMTALPPGPDEDASGAAWSARIAALRARLLVLAAAHARGELDAAAYESARRDAERELGEAVVAAPAAQPTPAPDGPEGGATAARPSARLVASLIAGVVAVAIAGYAFTGSPSLARLGAADGGTVAGTGAAGDTDQSREIGLQQIGAMVGKLAERMKSRPDDVEGWTMLARSYTVLGRYAEAVPAYRHAAQLDPRNPALLADFADTLIAANGGRSTPESSALIDRALSVDPAQPKALALAGTVAFERGDYAQAAAQWQKIADGLPPGSEFRQQVEANIDEARRRGNLSAAKVPSTPPADRGAASVGSSVSGMVTLAPALAARAAPSDTVFVFARAAEGARMPLAVFRATVADLPLHFKLDDRMAMTAMKLSDAKQVIVGARISKSGNALPQPGDLSGESTPVALGASGLKITIGSVVGAH